MLDISGLSNLLFLKQKNVLVFLLSRNGEISLWFPLLAGCRMFVLHNFKINQDYCLTAGIPGFGTKFWQLEKAILWQNLLKRSAFVHLREVSKAIKVYAGSFEAIFNPLTAPHPPLRLRKCYRLILVSGPLTNNISRANKTGFVAYGFK